MDKHLTLILGGARSGKSRHAEQIAKDTGKRVLYVATAQAQDEEMQNRIAAHQQARPATWQTVEAPVNVGLAINAALQTRPTDVVLVDCITLLMSNLILQGLSEEELNDPNVQIDQTAAQERANIEIDALLDAFRASRIPWIVVSNEVGWGLVPAYPLGRLYRDLLGWANQRMAAAADEVYLLVAGLPINVKALSQHTLGNQDADVVL